jgi:hypothetical protein
MNTSQIKSRALTELRGTAGILDFGIIKIDKSKGTILLFELFSHSPVADDDYDMVEIVERHINMDKLHILGDCISRTIGKHP